MNEIKVLKIEIKFTGKYFRKLDKLSIKNILTKNIIIDAINISIIIQYCSFCILENTRIDLTFFYAINIHVMSANSNWLNP